MTKTIWHIFIYAFLLLTGGSIGHYKPWPHYSEPVKEEAVREPSFFQRQTYYALDKRLSTTEIDIRTIAATMREGFSDTKKGFDNLNQKLDDISERLPAKNSDHYGSGLEENEDPYEGG